MAYRVWTFLLNNNPMKRVGYPEDVAGVVVFLASKDSSYVNGITLDVCGGDYIN